MSTAVALAERLSAIPSEHRRESRQPPLHRKQLEFLQQRARLGERQARKARMQRRRIAITEIAEEVRLDVAFRKELLVAAKTGPAGREELLVNLGLIETGYRVDGRPSITQP